MRDVIATQEGPQAIGPYSQAIRANGFVFVSGQVAIDPANQQVISGDVAAQTDRVIRNLAGILKAAGTSFRGDE
jgi:2-iminobutanoate/2-iminopropanoate deaminase